MTDGQGERKGDPQISLSRYDRQNLQQRHVQFVREKKEVTSITSMQVQVLPMSFIGDSNQQGVGFVC